MPPVEEWDTFPFDGEMRPRDLLPPVETEKPRFGEGGVDCRRCQASDDEYIWTSERWRVQALASRPASRSWSSSSRASTSPTSATSPTSSLAELGVMLGSGRARGPLGRRDRPRPRLQVGRRRRAPALVVHGPPRADAAADRQLRGDLGRHSAARARGHLAREPRRRRRRAGLGAAESRRQRVERGWEVHGCVRARRRAPSDVHRTGRAPSRAELERADV